MKIKLWVSFYLIFSTFVLFGQDSKRNDFWVIGSLPVVKYDFNNILQIDTVTNTSLSTTPYCILSTSSSCISDTNGQLQFFTNGFILYDHEGYAMDSGIYVNCPQGKILANYYGMSLFDQTSIILPKKGNTYYVFSTGMSDSVANNYLNHVLTEFDVLNYSVVDMDSNSGLGKVVQKNVVLADKQHYFNCAMQAVKHSNGKDWWLVKADCNNNRYQEFLVKEDTILGPFYQNISNIGDWCVSYSELYFSHDGSKLASSIYGKFEGTLNNRNRVDIYDFNRCSGELTFEKYYIVPYDTSSYPNNDFKNGVCFSANDSLLYMCNLYTIYQIDLNDTNTYNPTFIHGPDTTISQFPFYEHMAVAPNGKLYIGNCNGTRKFMSYIDSPNIKGLGCHFVPQGVWQPYTNLMSPPNMPNYGLGVDSSNLGCWTLQLNPDPVMQAEEDVHVYPNPANDVLTIKVQESLSEVLLLDMAGRAIKSETALHTNTYTLTVSDLPRGVYLLQVNTQSGTCYYRKVLLE